MADVGCGPGAILAVLAETVGPTGAVLGVDRDPQAVRYARHAIAGHPQAAAHTGDAHLSGLPVGVFDVAMCRHVLAHNGGRERVIVAHLATLVRPGGAVVPGGRRPRRHRHLVPAPPGLDIDERYRTFHARRGADLRIGTRLGGLLEEAGLVVERYRSLAKVMRMPPGVRGPAVGRPRGDGGRRGGHARRRGPLGRRFRADRGRRRTAVDVRPASTSPSAAARWRAREG